MKKVLVAAAIGAALVTSVSAKMIAFSQDSEGSRLNLHDDVCTEFTNADGVAEVVLADGQTGKGCWKYDKDTNMIFVIINGILLELPALAFTSL